MKVSDKLKIEVIKKLNNNEKFYLKIIELLRTYNVLLESFSFDKISNSSNF